MSTGQTRVLVVDDDPPVRTAVRRALRLGGAVVEVAEDGVTALQRHEEERFDVIILDHYLPGTAGLDILSEIRESDADVRVIMLTGAVSETDRIRCFAEGADDYLAKPFSVRELAARVAALERRRVNTVPALVEVGGLCLDGEARTATLEGQSVDLPRREHELLRHLASHPGRTFSRDELLEAVWHSSSEWQSAATVTEHIGRLRRRLRQIAHRDLIVTVRGAGYRLDVGTQDDDDDVVPASHVRRVAHDIANRLTAMSAGAELTAAEIGRTPDSALRQALLDDLEHLRRIAIEAADMAAHLVPGVRERAAVQALPEPPDRLEARERRPTVLLLEDDHDVRRTCERLLQRAGLHVLAAETAREAFELQRDPGNHIDMLVSDISISDAHGPDVAAQLRSRSERALPVVYMSGFSPSTSDLVPQDAPFLRKPFTGDALVSTVLGALGRDAREG